jgi:hypothetical protein
MTYAVDFKGDMGEVLSNSKLSIPRAHLLEVCKIREGSETCRYICCGIHGFVCVKNTTMKTHLDKQVDQMTAQGDNCEGFGQEHV